ncbi:flagellar assembly peptidoglycan hydrolase FlgJ [Halomonas getboli]|uniref:flagellar assembly peptidoglycan hydrolase FlgJ n=1 Tax=Halomonas getboli TaxID=2935862 RepID=UPI001FFEE44F|nr:flagellar assembly peptidoglycan hydrolase FlgJ [Halomonas getboli]MCK2184936.1 flagellar assembly peptidoglycan hydrolase FlgJ [Halomonas getboli]
MSLDAPDTARGQFALDIQGLERLKHNDSGEGLKDAAQQFEALFVQMMVKSMREAVPSSGLLQSQAGDMYQEMLDKQWSQSVAERGLGLADQLVSQLQGSVGGRDAGTSNGRDIEALIAGIPRGTPRPLTNALMADERSDDDATPASFLDAIQATPGDDGAALAASAEPAGRPEHVQAFLERLAGPARAASRESGVPAELILAQAALETGWGRREIATADGGNSHNLFGIKAGSGWRGETTEILTHEVIDGRRQPVRDRFRVYDSFEAAFTDYARLIGDNPRYAGVSAAATPDQAARALQRGGYATDPAYADKLIAVMYSLGPLPGGERLASR